MIKVEELKNIKKFFDKIFKGSNDKQKLAVSFSPVGAEAICIIMSNGIDYARLVTKTNQMHSLQAIQIAWQDFCKVCELFNKNVTYKIIPNKNVIEFFEGKTKLICAKTLGDTNDNCSFKFDFNSPDTQLVDMSNAAILKKQRGSLYDSICLWQNKIMSTDGSFGIINFLPNNFGEEIQLLIEKLPEGFWYYNKNNRIIVSQDKSIATTIKKGVNSFPNKALEQVSKTPLDYSFSFDVKEFLNILNKCSIMGEHVLITFGEINTMRTFEFETDFNATYEDIPVGFSIKIAINYFKYVLSCCEDKTATIHISKDKTRPMIRMELKDKVIFGMGVTNGN